MKILPGTQGKNIKVCDCHYEKVKGWKWSVFKGMRGSSYYAIRSQIIDGKSTAFLIHRFITDCPRGMVVDHINGNGLDNRCSNLRICTQGQNALNNRKAKKGSKSGHKGVYWHKAAQKWSAEVMLEGKKYYLGVYKNKLDAVEAYNNKAKELHGKYFAKS